MLIGNTCLLTLMQILSHCMEIVEVPNKMTTPQSNVCVKQKQVKYWYILDVWLQAHVESNRAHSNWYYTVVVTLPSMYNNGKVK